jgi:hypothetical protein
LAAPGSPYWVHVTHYVDDLPRALAAAEVAVSRAGALSTAELLLHGLPAILVPLPRAAADQQTHNARSLERAGAAIMTPQAGLTGGALWSMVADLLSSPERLETMRSAALGNSTPCSLASSRIVSTRSEPSRWTCKSAFGSAWKTSNGTRASDFGLDEAGAARSAMVELATTATAAHVEGTASGGRPVDGRGDSHLHARLVPSLEYRQSYQMG